MMSGDPNSTMEVRVTSLRWGGECASTEKAFEYGSTEQRSRADVPAGPRVLSLTRRPAPLPVHRGDRPPPGRGRARRRRRTVRPRGCRRLTVREPVPFPW
ncbi:hypothetical protein ACVWXU_008355 [Streptomyces sp. TE33382]